MWQTLWHVAVILSVHCCILAKGYVAPKLTLSRTDRPQSVETQQSTDPLATWLHGLSLDLGDIEASKFGMKFSAKGLVCSDLSIGRVQSDLSGASTGSPSFVLKLQGLGINCNAEWSLPLGSGKLTARVNPGASAAVTLALPLEGKPVPQRAEVTDCSADLDFAIGFGRGFEGRIISWLIWLVSGKIRSDVTSQICTALREAAATNLTKALQDLNHEMLPSDLHSTVSSPVSSVKGSGAPGSVDWTTLRALNVTNWMVKDLVGIDGIDQALNWALNGTGRIDVNGSAEALANFSIKSGASRLNVSVGLQSLVVDGLYGIRNLQPIVAADASSLEAGVSIGTDSRPAISATSNLWIHLSSQGPDDAVAPSEIDEHLEIKLGLEKPAINGRMELLVDEHAGDSQKTMAQWLFGAIGCARDKLLAPPSLQKFNVSFDGVSTPLSCTSKTEGALESDLALLFNHFVTLFNSLYLRYLPAAITRFASSERFRDLANKQLAELLKPTPAGQSSCIDKDEAAKKADELPKNADWRQVFGGSVRKYVDNIADGFLAHNVTDVVDALNELEPLYMKTDTNDFEFRLNKLSLAGMSKVQQLRIMEPIATDPESINNLLSIACATPEMSWRPTISMAGTVKSTTSPRKGVKVSTTFPCGEAARAMYMPMDLHRALEMSVPPNPFCAVSAFSAMALTDGEQNFTDSLQVLVEIEGRDAEDPVATLCSTYPRLCARVSSVQKKITGGRLNAALAASLKHARASCDDQPSMELKADDGSLGDTSPVMLWVSTGVCIALLTALIATPALGFTNIAKNRANEGLPNPMAFDSCAQGNKRSRGFMIFTSALLATALVLRTVSIFCLNVAYSDTYVEQDSFGRVMEIRLITFTFFGMVTHYWQAKAYLSSILLLVNSFTVAYLVILLPLILWLTPIFSKRRRMLLRGALFLSRFPFVDIIFFSILVPVLNSALKFPLGNTVYLNCSPDMGIFVGNISALCAIAALQCLLAGAGLDPTHPVSIRRNSFSDLAAVGLPVESCWRRTFKVGMPITFFVGLVAWNCTNFFEVTFTQLAGDILDAKYFMPFDVVSDVWKSQPIMAIELLVIVIFAPFLQTVAAALAVLGNPPPAMLIREIGNTFAALEVFFAGFVALTMEMDDIAEWIVMNKFGDLCNMQESLTGAKCMGLKPAICWGGALALFISVVSSFGFAVSCAVVDALRSKTARPLSQPRNFSSA